MAYKIILLSGATSDIREAAKWYDLRQPGLGRRFTLAIRDEISLIKQNPFLYTIRYDNVFTALIKTFPYLIHFSVENEVIVIKAVYHTSRDS